MAAMHTRSCALPRHMGLLALALLVLITASACAAPVTRQPAAPAASVEDQLAQLAAGAQPQPTATQTAAPASPRPTRRATATPTLQPTKAVRATRTPADRLPTIAQAQLPPEARRTIALIQQGGPFPYDKDGATFGNREGLLPKRPSSYYQEYTVVTPGSRDRGARRIVAGAGGELYYTDDHYDSFKRVIP